MLADALTRQGKHEAAVEAAKDGLSTEESTGHRQWKAELYRLEGVALCALNRPEEGQNALEQAMRIARGQQAKAYELRAAMSLARLWYDQSKRQQARALLAPVYAADPTTAATAGASPIFVDPLDPRAGDFVPTSQGHNRVKNICSWSKSLETVPFLSIYEYKIKLN
jgi:predicted ATPase